MSREAAARFLDSLQNDPELSKALTESGLARDGTFWGPELKDFAAENGFEFTLEELEGGLGAPKGDLDELALEEVVGGVLSTGVRVYSIGPSLRLSPAANCLPTTDCNTTMDCFLGSSAANCVSNCA